MVQIGGFYRNITSVLLHRVIRLRGRRGCWDGLESGGKSRWLGGQILQIFRLLVRERIHNYKVFPSAVYYRLLAILITFGGNNYFGCGDESCEKWSFILVIHADKSRRWKDQPRPQDLFIFEKRDPGEEVVRNHHKHDRNSTILSMRNCGLTLRAFFSWPTSAWRPKRRYLFLWYVEFSYWFSSSHSSFSYIISFEEHAS